MRGLAILSIMIFVLGTLVQQTYSQEEEFKFYGRGHVDPSHPVFGDEFIRTIIKGNSGAIIDVISHYGIVVIRMDLERDSNCDSSDFVICFNGKISKLKNVDHPNVGSEISLKLNLQEGTEEISILTGNMNGTNVLIYLENVGEGKNIQNKGNLKIDWQSCEVEYNAISGWPETVKIIPQVIDGSNNSITHDVKSKLRFSYDNKIEEASHAHLGYTIIEEFVIKAQNNEPIILNLTEAIAEAIEFNITPIQVESRHYTIFPSSQYEYGSFSNDDQVILEFILKDGRWIANQGICKSIIEK